MTGVHPIRHARTSRYVRFKRSGAFGRSPSASLRRAQCPGNRSERARRGRDLPSNVHGVQNAFTGAALDRAGDSRRRDPEWLAEQRAHPGARAVVAGDRGLRIAGERLELVPLSELNGAEPLLLGIDADGPVFARRRGPAARRARADGRRRRRARRAARPSGASPSDSRGSACARPPAILSRADGGLAAYAAALLNWHRRHRYCSACGKPSDVVEGGLTRMCPNCGAEHHPRTDPVVIMLVTDGDRLLLGRQARVAERALLGAGGLRRAGRGARGGGRARGARGGRRGRRPAALRRVAAVAVPGLADARLLRAVRGRRGGTCATTSCRTCAGSNAPRSRRRPRSPDTDDWGTPGDPGGPLRLPPSLAIARRLIDAWLADD